MTRWIFTAEADKIQHLVFRSSKLREVVGGSQLLTDFCAEATKTIPNHDRIVADGGSFTLLFNTKDAAIEFGRELAQQYYELTSSTLTVAEAVEWSGADADFPAANQAARQALAKAKREGRAPVASSHGPYMAFCASCGVELAQDHRPIVKEDTTAQYLCAICEQKAHTGTQNRSSFLGRFEQTVVDATHRGSFESSKAAEDLAEAWDARQYVAYLVADGNGMGKVFGQCQNLTQLRQLSEGLLSVIRESLAVPTRKLMKKIPPGVDPYIIPVRPLILGGDDVFVLLPATYALDFAREFCLQYEQQMAAKLQEIGLSGIQPTISAAVVICKSKYPHTLVHKRGEELLKQAKRLTKAVALREGMEHPLSIVNFDVILGSRLAHEVREDAKYRNTLAPYWVTSATTAPPERGLALEVLLEQRLQLARQQIPQRRLMQLRALFEPGALPDDTVKTVGLWNAALSRLQARVGRNADDLRVVEGALAALGGTTDGHWYYCHRPGVSDEDIYNAHGLPDLIRLWDFTWKLDEARSTYAVQED
ncbi:MAG TPA: hypothetical protein P5169_02510 [Kiritimatiellia bacterium]|nr:hypothetical protein [Kiritimatiellia bacterium]HXK42089.1 hypothetical protein [Anaerolineae bacterium]